MCGQNASTFSFDGYSFIKIERKKGAVQVIGRDANCKRETLHLCRRWNGFVNLYDCLMWLRGVSHCDEPLSYSLDWCKWSSVALFPKWPIRLNEQMSEMAFLICTVIQLKQFGAWNGANIFTFTRNHSVRRTYQQGAPAGVLGTHPNPKIWGFDNFGRGGITKNVFPHRHWRCELHGKHLRTELRGTEGLSCNFQCFRCLSIITKKIIWYISFSIKVW